MYRRILLTILIAARLPSLASAQGGGRGGRGGRGGDGRGEDKFKPTNDMPAFPATKELQKYNPVVLLIDNKKKLSLSDSLVTAMRVLQGQIYERNGDLIARYDSVQRIYKPENANDASSLAGDSVRQRALGQTRVMTAVFDTLLMRRQNDDLEALAMIADEKQKKRAADLLDKQDADFAKLAPQGSAPRGGRRRP